MPAPAEQLDIPTKAKRAAAARVYCFDFTREPELIAGETLDTPTVPAVSGLTIGSPSVLAAAFDGVQAGKGVKVQVSGGTAGTVYEVECRCTTSGGATLVSVFKLSVE